MRKRTQSRNGANLSFFSTPESSSSKGSQKFLFENEFTLKFTSDALDFYKQIYDMKALQKVEIISYERNEHKKYTSYLIQVDTVHLSFQIWKRYSDFKSWLTLVRQYIDPDTVLHFPPKKFINNQDDSFLKQRMQGLNNYISSFISNPQPQLVSLSFLDFIDVRRQYIIHQIKLTTGIQSNFQQDKKANPDEEQILDFVEQMNSDQENLTYIFNEIQSFFVQQKPRLTNESINSLFQGCKQFCGLIQTIGQQDNSESGSHLICSAGLKLIYSLLDYEVNRDAETFIRVFSQLPTKTIFSLKLSHHIIPDHLKPCKHYALRILELYTTKNNIRKSEQILQLVFFQLYKQLQDNHQAFDQFEQWYKQKSLYGF